MANLPAPKLNAMLVCDQIIVDATTGKKSLIGVFEDILAPKFPVRHPSLTVYINMTDANGEYEFRLELVDLSTGEVLGCGTMGPHRMDGRLKTHEVGIGLNGLVFERPGKYEFQISANGELFGQKTFTVRDAQENDAD